MIGAIAGQRGEIQIAVAVAHHMDNWMGNVQFGDTNFVEEQGEKFDFKVNVLGLN